MPLYEFKCKKCNFLFEELTGSTKSPKCKKCGGETIKQVSSFSSIIKGGSSKETVDMTIGREANNRWQSYYDRASKRRSNKQLKEVTVPRMNDGKYSPVMALGNKEDRSKRTEYVGALKEHRQKRIKSGQGQFDGPGGF